MQKTDFLFEVLIHDDASTDGTEEIIREYEVKYPDIIKPLYEKENQWVKGRKGSAVFNFPRARGKYIALCEGDDYWTDPYKLQKQVDILEKMPNVFIVYTGFTNVNENDEIIIRPKYDYYQKISRSGNILSLLMRQNFIMTVSSCIRNDVINSSILRNCPVTMDYAFFLTSAVMGDAFFMQESTCCYRLSSSSVMSTDSIAVHNNARKIHLYFSDKYLSGEVSRVSFFNDINIKQEILIKMMGMYLAGTNRTEIRGIISHNKTIFLYLPTAIVLAVYRQIVINLRSLI
jgi:glycosyltransferase involved in cell wall biosynthesis